MITMTQSAANWRYTHTHLDRTYSRTHLHRHSYSHLVRIKRKLNYSGSTIVAQAQQYTQSCTQKTNYCSGLCSTRRAHLADSLVRVQASHAVLESGENSPLDVQGPQLVVLRGTQLVHHAVLEGEAQGLSFQQGGSTC